jgi:hypothetical protein
MVFQAQSNGLIGSVKFHTWSSKIELDTRAGKITYKDIFDSGTGLGRVYWKYQGERNVRVI